MQNLQTLPYLEKIHPTCKYYVLHPWERTELLALGLADRKVKFI
jgi:hypothetical protein